MKFPTLGASARSASLWITFGCVGLAILSIYFIKDKYFPAIEYPFLTDPNTIKFFNISKTIVIVQRDRDLKNKIEEVYGNIAVFCSAKTKSELIAEVKAFCQEGRNIIVVKEEILCENTEHCIQGSLDPLPELAEQYKYSVHITKPSKKLIPVYAGWLLNERDSRKILTEGESILKNLLTAVPQFSSSFRNFSGQASIQDMLKYYQLAASNANGMLHCTAKYLGNGTVPGSYKYWNNREVRTNLGRSYGLDVIGLVWTPRTFGARVKLSKEELQIWGNDDNGTSRRYVGADVVQAPQTLGKPATWGGELTTEELSIRGKDDSSTLSRNVGGDEKKTDFSPTKGRGSRAHITVGVADGVQAVVTGKDLEEIVRLEALHRDWPTYACQGGWLRDYGAGQWVLYSDSNTTVASLFDGVYVS